MLQTATIIVLKLHLILRYSHFEKWWNNIKNSARQLLNIGLQAHCLFQSFQGQSVSSIILQQFLENHQTYHGNCQLIQQKERCNYFYYVLLFIYLSINHKLSPNLVSLDFQNCRLLVESKQRFLSKEFRIREIKKIFLKIY